MTSDIRTFGEKALHAVEYGETLRPARDWFALLAIAGLLIAASAAWNAWVFFDVSSAERPDRENADAAGNPEGALRQAEALMQERAAEAARYRGEYPFVDPS